MRYNLWDLSKNEKTMNDFFNHNFRPQPLAVWWYYLLFWPTQVLLRGRTHFTSPPGLSSIPSTSVSYRCLPLDLVSFNKILTIFVVFSGDLYPNGEMGYMLVSILFIFLGLVSFSLFIISRKSAIWNSRLIKLAYSSQGQIRTEFKHFCGTGSEFRPTPDPNKRKMLIKNDILFFNRRF